MKTRTYGDLLRLMRKQPDTLNGLANTIILLGIIQLLLNKGEQL